MFIAGLAVTHAQWLNYPAPGVPRLPNGKVNLAAKPPRTPDGKPDLTGVWYPNILASDTSLKSADGPTLGEDSIIRLRTVDGSPIPFLPAAQQALTERRGERGPASQCLPHTLPDSMLVPSPFKFLRAPGVIILLFEEYNQFRQIFTDGRPFPTEMQPAWFGYSIGRWDGDTFVVDTRGLNDRGWLDVASPIHHSEQMHITERFTRPNVGTLQLRVIVDDPTMFSRTWESQTLVFRLLADTEFIENICENERDAAHTGRK
jgi:hypothetical protein